MDDIIYRQAAIDTAKAELDGGTPYDIPSKIETLPSAQPERMRGRWLITDAYPHNVYCSKCYMTFAQTHWAVWEDGTLPRNFCPNCGIRMEIGGR